jgi:hypothetical protein
MGMEPPEVSSIKTLLGVVRIITLVFGILFLLAGLATVLVALAFGAFGFFGAFFLIGFVIDLIIFMEVGQIRDMVNAGQLQAAKEKTFIWMILGFILGGVITGILLLVAWIKFDGAIAGVQRMQGGAGWGQPQAAPVWQQPQAAPVWQQPPMMQQPVMAAPPPVAAPMGAGTPATCPRCGKPATWIAQYNRWYCYTDQQYV